MIALRLDELSNTFPINPFKKEIKFFGVGYESLLLRIMGVVLTKPKL